MNRTIKMHATPNKAITSHGEVCRIWADWHSLTIKANQYIDLDNTFDYLDATKCSIWFHARNHSLDRIVCNCQVDISMGSFNARYHCMASHKEHLPMLWPFTFVLCCQLVVIAACKLFIIKWSSLKIVHVRAFAHTSFSLIRHHFQHFPMEHYAIINSNWPIRQTNVEAKSKLNAITHRPTFLCRTVCSHTNILGLASFTSPLPPTCCLLLSTMQFSQYSFDC